MAYIEKRVTSNGVVRWRVQVRRLGAPDLSRTFSTKARAKAWAVDVEAGITGDSPRKHTLGAAMKRYAEKVSPHKRGARWEDVRLTAMQRDPMASLPIGRVTADVLGHWRDRRLKEVSPGTVLRDFNLLAAVFEAARLEWKWVRENPVRDVKKPPEPPARRRGVKDGELSKLREVATTQIDREILDGFELAIETGMRAGEMWNLEREQVAGLVATLDKTKNGDSREVALSTRASEIVEALFADGRPTLFMCSNAVRDVIFRRLREKAKVTDLHFHDSRSEAVSRLAKKLPILELAAQIGHRDIKSLQSYYRPSAEDRARQLSTIQTKRPRKKPANGASPSRRS